MKCTEIEDFELRHSDVTEDFDGLDEVVVGTDVGQLRKMDVGNFFEDPWVGVGDWYEIRCTCKQCFDFPLPDEGTDCGHLVLLPTAFEEVGFEPVEESVEVGVHFDLRMGVVLDELALSHFGNNIITYIHDILHTDVLVYAWKN